MLYFFPTIILSQNLSNLKIKNTEYSDTIYVDSLNIIPNSIEIISDNKIIPNSLYHYNFKNSTIIFKEKLSQNLIIKYRTIDYNFNQQISPKDTSLIVKRLSNYNDKNYYLPNQSIDNIINRDKLTKTGVFSRGISVGNNQDPVVNSKLNLQLSGKLSNDISVEAVITDESTPVQPDGNTAQIQDFSKIYIRVSNNNSQLVAGDFSVQKPESYFLKYNKQVKGLEYSTTNQNITPKINIAKSNFGLAVVKGKYNRQSITGVEGNQGPYKLQGVGGETYIMIISDSERIFLNGKLLVRGENNDYTINYNSAEIFFTAQQLITKDSRIIIEFEYTERHYSRFSYFTNNQFSAGGINFFVNVYSETDAKNQTIDTELTNEMKMLLFNAGDSLSMALFQNIDSVEYDNNKILYKKVDTLINSQVFSYYEYSTDQNLSYFQLNFSYVGKNKGNYVIDNSQTNGRVYKWIMPQNGVLQGNYEAATILTSPKKKQLFDFGMNIPLSTKSSINFEFALSNNDLNLFSDKHDNDNFGKAFKIDFNKYIKGNDTSRIKSFFWVKYEFAETRFKAIELYKNQEFKRNWNINRFFETNEHIAELGFLSILKKGEISATTSSLYHSKEYFGINTNFSSNYGDKKNNFTNNINFLYSADNLNITKYTRSSIDYERKISQITLGINYEQETNVWKKLATDSIINNSFMFHSINAFVQNSDTSNNFIKINYNRRWDYLPSNNGFKLINFSNNFGIDSKFIRKTHSIDILINYRELSITDSLLSINKPENTITGRVLLRFLLLNNSFQLASAIDISSGMEQKLQFIYIEVEPPKGVYMWNDYNNDGIKQTDEFEIAMYSDQAKYIRVPLQSNQYVKVFGKKITQSIIFLPENLFKQNTKIYKFSTKINNSFAFNIEHKSFAFNILDFQDSTATNYSLFLNNILTIRVNKKTTLNYILQKSKTTNLLINGTEKNELYTNKIIIKYQLSNKFTLLNKTSLINKKIKSDFSIMRNFHIYEKRNSIDITYSTNNIDLTVKYTYSDKKNLTGNEILFNNTLKFSTTSILSKKNRISTELSLINNNFHGDISTSVAYSMLEGLKPDLNLIWLINVKRNIGKTIQITFLYSGRYAQNSRIINTGTVNLSAYF